MGPVAGVLLTGAPRFDMGERGMPHELDQPHTSSPLVPPVRNSLSQGMRTRPLSDVELRYE